MKPANCWLTGYVFSTRNVSARRHFCKLHCGATKEPVPGGTGAGADALAGMPDSGQSGVPATSSISGPLERLVDGEADLILHHIDKADPRLEFIDPFAISKTITPEAMRDYYLLEGARSWTVSDQLMNARTHPAAHGLGPHARYLIERDLRDKRLLPITGKHFRGGEVELVAARLRNAPHGAIATRLWQFIADQAARIVPAS